MFLLNIFVLGLLGPGPARVASPCPDVIHIPVPSYSRIHIHRGSMWDRSNGGGYLSTTAFMAALHWGRGSWGSMECGGSHDVRLEELGTHAGRICHAQKFFSSGRTVQGRRTAPMAGPSSTSLTGLVAEALHTVLNLSVYFFGGTKWSERMHNCTCRWQVHNCECGLACELRPRSSAAMSK